MTELVNQRTDKDCQVACLAMYMQVSYEEAEASVLEFNFKPPLSDDEVISVLQLNGFKPVKLHQWVWQARGILAVPSLNFIQNLHVIFWTGDDIKGNALDPQQGRENRKFYTSEKLIKGELAWCSFIAEADDEMVKLFAHRELEELSKALDVK